MSDLAYIYSVNGEPVGFRKDDFIYTLNGRPVGQLDGTRVHKLSGSYIGDLQGDMVVESGVSHGSIGSRGTPGKHREPRDTRHASEK